MDLRLEGFCATLFVYRAEANPIQPAHAQGGFPGRCRSEDCRFENAPQQTRSSPAGLNSGFPERGKSWMSESRVHLRWFIECAGRTKLRLFGQERCSRNGAMRLRQLRCRRLHAIGLRRLERSALRHSGTKGGKRFGVAAESHVDGLPRLAGRLVRLAAQCGQACVRRIEDRPDSSRLNRRIGRSAFCWNGPVDRFDRTRRFDVRPVGWRGAAVRVVRTSGTPRCRSVGTTDERID